MDRDSRYVILISGDYLKLLNKKLIELGGGEGIGVKDTNLFESLLVGYNQEVFGVKLYPDIESKISYIVYSIICNHIFRDANKRTGMVVLKSLCKKNNIDISNIDIKKLAILLATSKISIDDLTYIIKNNNMYIY